MAFMLKTCGCSFYSEARTGHSSETSRHCGPSGPWDSEGSGTRPDVNTLPAAPGPGGPTGPGNQEDCGGADRPARLGTKGGRVEGQPVTCSTGET